jgi:regulator of ribonuclease activity A
MDLLTTDLCDEYADKLNVAEPIGFNDYGKKKCFSGEIVTLKCFEANPLVRKNLEQNGEGKVLVVDAGGSKRCAMVGDKLGDEAFKNKWNGIIVYGCIRDSAELAKIEVGVKALGTHPLKSARKMEGEENIKVHFAGIDFVPGEYVYCDEDGIVVSKDQLSL